MKLPFGLENSEFAEFAVTPPAPNSGEGIPIRDALKIAYGKGWLPFIEKIFIEAFQLPDAQALSPKLHRGELAPDEVSRLWETIDTWVSGKIHSVGQGIMNNAHKVKMDISGLRSPLTADSERQLLPREKFAVTKFNFSESTAKIGETSYSDVRIHFSEHPQNAKPESLASAELNCRNWLIDISSDDKPKAKSKTEYLKEARGKFSGLSDKAFKRAWANVPEDWKKAGAPKKKKQKP